MSTIDNIAHQALTDMVALVAARTTGQIDIFNFGYIANDGTYILANNGRDLIAVLPTAHEGTHVRSLHPAASPHLVKALREALDSE